MSRRADLLGERERKNRLLIEIVELIVKLDREGESDHGIAARTGVSEATVKRKMQRYRYARLYLGCSERDAILMAAKDDRASD